jgi:hypothetical protein
VELAHLQRKQEMDRQKRLLLDMYLHHCSRHNDIGKTFLTMDSVLKTTIEYIFFFFGNIFLEIFFWKYFFGNIFLEFKTFFVHDSLDTETIKLLLQADVGEGARVNAKDMFEHYPLYMAVKRGTRFYWPIFWQHDGNMHVDWQLFFFRGNGYIDDGHHWWWAPLMMGTIDDGHHWWWAPLMMGTIDVGHY